MSAEFEEGVDLARVWIRRQQRRKSAQHCRTSYWFRRRMAEMGGGEVGYDQFMEACQREGVAIRQGRDGGWPRIGIAVRTLR